VTTKRVIGFQYPRIRYAVARDGRDVGTVTLKHGAHGWLQENRDPFDQADRYWLSEVGGELQFTLNRE
jgi:hypothetical protein